MTNTPSRDGPTPGAANIADPFWDLLLLLDEPRRQGFIRRLAVGFYEDWHPTRAEVAFLVDVELGRKSFDDAMETPQSASRTIGVAMGSDTAPVDEFGDDSTGQPVNGNILRAAFDPAIDIRPKAKVSALATFNVDCGLLATPFRFIAYGLSSAGWTVRMGGRYRRAFLHYRLVSSVRSAAAQSRSVTPLRFSGEISCIPDIAAPFAADDGRSRNHSPRASAVLGSRGPWPIAEGVRVIDFLITAQSPAGNRQRRQPAGSLRVDLPAGTAHWRASPGRDQSGIDRAAAH